MSKTPLTPGLTKETPLMQQYLRLKAKYRDAILLFRVGDFYETFGEDAIKTAEATGIVLTRRNNGGSDIELAGFPYHAMDVYMPKLVRAGLRVAVCEQLEKPSKDKKIVRRGVTEVITPGVTTDDKLLDQRTNNYLAAVFAGKQDRIGTAFVDISTGEFLTIESNRVHLSKLIQQYQPKEVLIPKSQEQLFQQQFGNRFNTYNLEEWVFTDEYAQEKLLRQFSVTSLKGFGIHDLVYGQIAAGAILHYLSSTENNRLAHIRTISRIHQENHVWLDQFTVRNLELVHSPFPQGKSLLQVLDDSVTAMGARLMRHWIQMPLLSLERIKARQSLIHMFQQDQDLADRLTGFLKEIGDLERLLARAVVGKISPREFNQLARALELTQRIKELLQVVDLQACQSICQQLEPCEPLTKRIRLTIQTDPPATILKGDVICDGLDEILDEHRYIIRNSKEILVELQLAEAQQTGISNLKVGYNSVFGYYLEVTNKYKNLNMIPAHWVRKQSTSNSERYVTDELKKLEERILGAEEKAASQELALFEALIQYVHDFLEPIQQNAAVLARLDVLLGFARLATRRNYICPEMDEGYAIDIKEGRHPVIESQMPPGEFYIPNDIYLDPDDHQILMITGPNMAGKSALLRQTALICLMAQMGSFVPAAAAKLGLIDKIFTRVGASDSISSGESTFMVEMNETALIMNNISDRSLILLDEIGRGTATYDGISIAWAIAEYLHENGKARPKSLFATHYHELNSLSEEFPRIRNFHVATKESGNKVLFLRKLLPGGIEHSFGIHVAQMAGMPTSIVQRATEILHHLEAKNEGKENDGHSITQAKSVQLSFFDTIDPTMQDIRKAISDLELNQMTPIECMLKLQELKHKVQVES